MQTINIYIDDFPITTGFIPSPSLHQNISIFDGIGDLKSIDSVPYIGINSQKFQEAAFMIYLDIQV